MDTKSSYNIIFIIKENYMSAYVLKLIAIITMLFDHSGYLIYGHLSWMNFVGRIAFPIFAFQISEGCIHTHNLKKYFVRLIIFALISQIPYAWFGYCFFSAPLYRATSRRISDGVRMRLPARVRLCLSRHA